MIDHELHDDNALKALLKTNTVKPPVDDVDWATLHARITTAAAPRFSDRRRTFWWQQVAGWSPRGVPVAAAAAAVLALVLGTGAVDTSVLDSDTTSSAFLTLEEELAAGAAVFLAASDDADAVIDALLFQEMED